MTQSTNFSFKYQTGQDGTKSRLGTLATPSGAIQTPAFIFCATKASIKGLSPEMMKQAGSQIILSNTYHLMIQPTAEVVEKLGGIQKFMGWEGPMLTDSGGFQIFSLGCGSVADEIKGKRNSQRPTTLLKITEEGAKFRSYWDGSVHMLSPERSIQVQKSVGADLIVCFDECTPFHVDKRYTLDSMHRSHRWEERSLKEFEKICDPSKQALYGIIQGGVYEDLRTISTDFVNSKPFFGHAIGGSLGADKNQMYDVVSYTAQRLDPSRPIHLLGIGGVRDIFHGVRQGIDTFDCVHPTRIARHGGALVKASYWNARSEKPKELISVKNSRFRLSDEVLDATDPFLKKYSLGYIHHLVKSNELLAMQIITYHNVKFMNDLMSEIRRGIKENCLNEVEREWAIPL